MPCHYEPGVQRTHAELARHYGTVILPARPAKPRDKAKIEVGVQVAERWILAHLRYETFFALAALNARIAELLILLNARRMRRYGASRQELSSASPHRRHSALGHESPINYERRHGAVA